jgi:hypothetical protein
MSMYFDLDPGSTCEALLQRVQENNGEVKLPGK